MTTVKLENDMSKKQLRNYYYEVLMIWTRRGSDNILSSISYTYKKYFSLFIIYIIYILIYTLYIIFFKPSFFVLFFYVLFLLFIPFLLNTFFRVEKMVSGDKKRKDGPRRMVLIDKDELSSQISDSKISIKWKDIKSLLIGDYSITFLPKDLNDYLISLPIHYKDKVLDALKKEKVKIDTITKSNNC